MQNQNLLLYDSQWTVFRMKAIKYFGTHLIMPLASIAGYFLLAAFIVPVHSPFVEVFSEGELILLGVLLLMIFIIDFGMEALEDKRRKEIKIDDFILLPEQGQQFILRFNREVDNLRLCTISYSILSSAFIILYVMVYAGIKIQLIHHHTVAAIPESQLTSYAEASFWLGIFAACFSFLVAADLIRREMKIIKLNVESA